MKQDEEEEKGYTNTDPSTTQFLKCARKKKKKFEEGGLNINFVNVIPQAKI